MGKEGDIGLAKKAGNTFATAYLILIFGIYPFFMKQGYVDIGEAKYHFFIYCSFGALGILGPAGFMCLWESLSRRIKKREPYLIAWERLSATDWFVLLYAVEIFISYFISDYPSEALWGMSGWHMGFLLLFLLCLFYFFTSRFWNGGKAVCYVGMAASGVVYILGILDRFSLSVIPLEIRQPSFISTLGNINWFCGYLSVISPIGICLFLFRKEKGERSLQDKFQRLLLGFYIVVSFMAGFCQGSSSVFLFFGALFFALLWIAVKKKIWLRDYFLLAALWGFSGQAVRLMRILMPGGYNYEKNNLCAYMTDSNLTLLAGGISLGVYFLYGYLGSRKGVTDPQKTSGFTKDAPGIQKAVHGGMLLILVGSILLWLVLSGMNTQIGIPGLKQRSEFLLNEEWGHGRGAAVLSGIKMYGKMPVIHKLFGIGPDCFSAYAYSQPEIAARLRDFYGESILTNAHNELLTGLVNTGLLGICLYMGIFISFICRCMRKGAESPQVYALAVCVFCYVVHNMVSFAHVLNLPYVFLLMGMGEFLLTEKRQFLKIESMQ